MYITNQSTRKKKKTESLSLNETLVSSSYPLPKLREKIEKR